jgi:hypothetical protein
MEKVLSISNFNILKKIFFNSFITLSILLVFDLILKYSVMYTFKYNESSSGVFRISDSLKKTTEKELIFIGNSRVVNNIDPRLSDGSYKITNLGVYETGLKFWYIYLQMTADLGLNKKYVLEIADGEFIGESYSSNIIKKYLLPNIKNNNLHTEELEFNFMETILYNTHIFTYQSIIPHLLKAIFIKQEFNGYINKGEKSICLIGPKCKSPRKIHTLAKPKSVIKDHYYLNKIMKLIKDRDLDVTFFIAPIHSAANLTTKCKEESLIHVVKYLREENFTVLNYAQNEDFRNKDELFFDLSHLNGIGSSRFTKIVFDEILTRTR